MAHFTSLRDFYSFPGFTPNATVRGVFGDPYAAVITLRRHPQKLSAVNVVSRTAPSTTRPSAEFATSIAAGDVSTWNPPCGGSIAGSVTP
jgi:hypothetical protein